jgi:predicted ATPase
MPECEARDQSELGLQVELGYALIPQQGWAAGETARAFTRAGELSRRIADAPKLFRALWGLAAFHFVRGDQREARGVADQCLTFAKTADDIDALIEAHYINGTVACAGGDFVGGSEHLEQCIHLHGNEPRDAHRMQYAQDAMASALGWLALALWTRGDPDQALARATQALARVRDASQPFVRARALAAVGFVRVLRGEQQDVGSPLDDAIELCVEQRFTYFHAILSAFAGMNLTQFARIDEGIALIQQSLRRLRTIGSELMLTVVYSYLAAALCARECIDEGLDAIAEGVACVERNNERWGEAELYRLRAELLLARSANETAEAEGWLRNALATATAQQANTYRLRAATSLARLCARLGRRTEGRLLLAEALAVWPARSAGRELETARALGAELQ